jgi:hypothetical protein
MLARSAWCSAHRGIIMKPILPKIAEVYRVRAQRTRDLIEHMEAPTTRGNLLRMAEEYEDMARRIDERR